MVGFASTVRDGKAALSDVGKAKNVDTVACGRNDDGSRSKYATVNRSAGKFDGISLPDQPESGYSGH